MMMKIISKYISNIILYYWKKVRLKFTYVLIYKIKYYTAFAKIYLNKKFPIYLIILYFYFIIPIIRKSLDQIYFIILNTLFH